MKISLRSEEVNKIKIRITNFKENMQPSVQSVSICKRTKEYFYKSLKKQSRR